MFRPALFRPPSPTLIAPLAANPLPAVLALPSTAAGAAEVAADLRMAENWGR